MGAVRRATDNAMDNCLVVAQHAHFERGPLVAPQDSLYRPCTFNQHKIHAGVYHGRSLSGHDKDEVLKNWRSGVIRVMVATKAFGLGIDQPDIEVVVKIGVPQSLEELIQGFGRAGRDGRIVSIPSLHHLQFARFATLCKHGSPHS